MTCSWIKTQYWQCEFSPIWATNSIKYNTIIPVCVKCVCVTYQTDSKTIAEVKTANNSHTTIEESKVERLTLLVLMTHYKTENSDRRTEFNNR